MVSAALVALIGSLAPGSGLAGAVGGLAWLPSTVLLELVRLLGGVPGAALATGRLGLPAALGLAAALLLWGLWGLPDADGLRAGVAERLGQASGSLRAALSILLGSLLALGCSLLVRPDGHLHVRALDAGTGSAILVRGPTGQTALVVAGSVDATTLTDALADALPVWEHGVDTLLVLDGAAQAREGALLQRYTATHQIEPPLADTRVDLGGGAALDVQANSSDQPADVSVSFGAVWLSLLGSAPSSTLLPGAGDELSLSGQP
jgi:hypothetical protein